MPSSGSIDYELDAAGIIEHALKEMACWVPGIRLIPTTRLMPWFN